MSTAATLAACLLVIALAAPLVVWLKREGDRSWARHQARRQRVAAFARVGVAAVTITANVAAFSAAMRKAGLAARDFERSIQRVSQVTGQPLSDYTRNQTGDPS